jgi:hypothetical protein
MKKIYYINLLNIERKGVRKSIIHQLAFKLKGINYNINKNKDLYLNKKKIDVGLAPSLWKYVGEIKDFLPNGKGKITSEDYDYDGDFINGKATGKGKENNKGIWGLGSYEGDFIDNVRHGKGTFNFYDGSKYIGDWKKDYRDGKGTYIWPDGFKLEGKWSKDFFVGLSWGHGFAATRANYLLFYDGFDLTSKCKFTSNEGRIKLEKINPEISFEGNFFKYIDFNEKEIITK